MGERVVVNPAREDPPKVVPLEYGHGSAAGDAWQRTRSTAAMLFDRLRATAAPLSRRVEPLLSRGVRALGGMRQIGFAIGLACLFGGWGEVLSRYGDGTGVAWMAFGGILIGLSIRFPWLR